MSRGLSDYRNKLKDKKKDDEKNKSSSSTATKSTSGGLSKFRLERNIKFDTLESDLKSMGETVDKIDNEWQTQETMKNTRSAVESMYHRLTSYQDYQKQYGGGADVTDLVSAYKTALEGWDDRAKFYGQYKDAESYTTEKTKLDELNKMTVEEVEEYLKDEKNPIAYTTFGGQDITWQSLYDDKKRTKMATSKEGKSGYNKYLEDQEKAQKEKEKSQPSAFEETVIRGFTTSSDLPVNQIVNNVIYDKRNDESYKNPTDEWTDAERNIFGAYYLENPQSAYDYATELNNQKAIEKKNKTKTKISDNSTSNFGSGALNWAGAVLTSPFGLADFLDDLTDVAAGRDTIVEENIVTPFEYSQTVKGSQSNLLNEYSGTLNENIPVIGGKGLGDVYNLGTSIVESKMMGGLSKLAGNSAPTLVSFFGQGAAGTVDDVLARGGTTEQALLKGTVVGALEGLSEQAGIDNLLKVGDSNTLKQLFINALIKQPTAEGLEETFSALGEKIADDFIMQDKSNFNSLARKYQTEGLSEKEAKRKAWIKSFEDVAFDTIGGYISGLAHGGMELPVGMYNIHSQNKSIGQDIRNNERVNDLFDIGQLTPRESDAYNLYTEYAVRNNRDNVTDAQLGNLYSTIDADARNTLSSKKSTLEQKRAATETLKKLSAVDEKNTVSKDTINVIDQNISVREGYMESANELIAEGLESGKDTKSYKLATEYKQKLDKGEQLTEKEIANLVKANSEAISDEDISLLSEDDAALFKSVYDGKTNKDDFLNSFNLVTGYAKNNFSPDYILEHKGVLTEKQVAEIYKAKVLNSDKSLENAIANLKEKHEGTPFIEGTFNDSVINYENTKVDGKVNWNSLKPSQKRAIAILGQVGKGMGMDVELISDGLERGINGAFEISGNKMLIDIYAGMDKIDGSKLKDTIIPTTSHEMTHWMQNKSPEIYRKYDQYVFDTLKMSGLTEHEILESRRKKMEAAHPDATFTDAEVRDEVIARASEDMFAKSEEIKKFLDSLTETEKKSFVDKIKEILNNIKEWLGNFLSEQKSNSDEAKIIRQYQDRIDEQIKLWDKMLVSSVAANQALKKENITAETLANKTAKNSVQEMAREDDNVKYYQNFLEDLPIAEYNKLTIKKPIRVSNAEKEAVESARTKRYAGFAEEDIPVIDVINLGEYKVLNSNDYYFIRNADKLNYSIVKHSKTIKRRQDKYANIGNGQARNETYRGTDVGNESKKIERKYDKGNSDNRPSTNQQSFRKDVEGSQRMGETDRRVSVSKGSDNLGRGVNNSDRDKDIRFSLRDNVEETKDLVAVHNLSEEKLLKSLKLGGLPMPSIAIARAKEGYSNFGKISLVFNKETIDPQNKRSNKVYSGDAWTPTYPRVEYKISYDSAEKVRDKINELLDGTDYKTAFGYLALDTDSIQDYFNRNGGDVYDAYGRKEAFKLAFLKDKGVELELPSKEKQFTHHFDNDVIVEFANKYGKDKIVEMQNYDNTSMVDQHIPEIKEIVERYYSEQVGKDMEWQIDRDDVYAFIDGAGQYFTKGIVKNTDTYAARDIINSAIDENEYKSWLNELFSGIVEKEGIRNNQDMFTPSGNRRSFEALHYEHNLENVIKAMKGNGEKGIGSFGGGNIFGAATTEYNSISEIKDAAQNRLKSMSQEEYDEIRKGFSHRLFELAYSLPIHKDSFTATDDAANMLIEAVTKFKTKSGMANYLRSESKGWANYSDYVVDDLVELVNDIRNMPVSYFEAKPQRAVGFNEVATAIIPDNSSDELKSKLTDNGVKFVEYENGNEESRLNALNSLENVKFSDRDKFAPTFYSQMGKTIDEMKQDKIGANSVVSYLKGRGVKNEEIKWSGIETFLEGKKSVTKAELQEFVAGSMLQIEESTYDGIDIEVISEDGDNYIVRNKETREILDEWEWSEDVEDGMEGYVSKHGEIALSVDEIEEIVREDWISTRWRDYSLEGGSNYREITFKMPNTYYSNYAMRTHWGEYAYGILAHARIQDFETDNGKMLFIEEIQSDWHNEGHKVGYAKKLSQEEVEKVGSILKKQESLMEQANEKYRAGDIDGARVLFEKEQNLFKERKKIEGNKDGTPDAPFKENYHEYVLKRLLRLAAEQGYDSIGWTTADIQSERWSDEYAEGYRIEYDQDIPKFLNKYGKKWGAKVDKTNLRNHNQETTYYDEFRDKDFSSASSWEVAVKASLHQQGMSIEEIQNNVVFQEYEDSYIAYNSITGEDYATAEIRKHGMGDDVWSMEITDSMKDSVLYEGQVMYSDRDKAYMDAVNNGDMETAQRLVDEVAKEAGYKSPMLYHGTGDFGFTRFRDGLIFATNDASISAGYTNNKGYGRKRSIAEAYTKDDGTVETLIKNAKNVLGWNLHQITETERKQYVEEIKQSSAELSDKVNGVWQREAMDVLPNLTEELDNDISWVLSLPGSINENIDDVVIYAEDMQRWVEHFNESRERVREYLIENRDSLKDTPAWTLYQTIMGYELGDFAIDVEYKLLKSINKDSLVSESGGIVSQDSVKSQVETAKDVGSYSLYGSVGNNPLVIDGKGAMWTDIYVDDWGGYFSTESIGKKAKEQGYTSVQIKDIYDMSMNEYAVNKKSDVYIFFDSNQIKSADPVTYDDNGNVIPLSQRFNAENEDIRYSDRDYVETNSKAVMTNKRIDYLIEDSGAGKRVDYANYWITSINPTDFLNMTLTKYLQDRSEFDKYPSEWNENSTVDTYDYIGELKKNMRETPYLAIDITTGKVVGHEGRHRMRALEKKGITSAEIRIEFRDEDGRIVKYSPDGKRLQIKDVLKIKNQYNTNQSSTIENIIPLNEDYREEIFANYGENNSQGKDVLYSDRDKVSIYDLMGENDKLIKENEQLKEDVERLKERLKIERQVTNGNYFNENQLDAVAGHIRNIAHSNYNKKDLVTLLNGIYQYIAHSPDLNWQDLYAQCYDVASMVLSESRPITETNEYCKRMLKDIRNTKVSVNEKQVQEAKYTFGNRWRNVFFNKIKFVEYGTSLDSQWQEWAAIYPDVFDKDVTDANMLVKLYDILDSVREGSEMIVEYDTEEETRQLAREIYNQYWNVSPIRTTADKYDKQIKRLNFEHRKAMKEFRDSYDEKLKNQHKVDKEKAQELIKKIRERKDKEIAEVKQRSKERMDAYKENAERKTKIQSITSNALTLNKWLTKNSKEYHIHEALKGPVIKLLHSINFSSKKMLEQNIPTKKDITFRAAFKDIQKMLDDAQSGNVELVELYGHDLAENMQMLVDAADNIVGDNHYVINQMSLEELQSLERVVKYIKQVVTQFNEFHTVHHKEGIAHLSQENIAHLDSLGEGKEHGGVLGKLSKLFKWDNATPYHAFNRLGKAGVKVFEALQDGWDALAKNVKVITDFVKETYTSKEVKSWGKETKTFTILQPDGKKRTFKMTIAQMMAFHCVSKQPDAMRHLLSSGMTLASFEENGKVVKDKKNILLTKSDIDMIRNSLTARQREVADGLQGFMNTTCSNWGNEVSLRRFGIKMFGLPDYFPIKVSPAAITKEEPNGVEDTSLFRLLNMSFTKSRNEFAAQSIEIGNIFDIFAQHTSDMAKYNALALPVLDAYRWYSFKGKTFEGNEYSVYASMQTALGEDSVRYFNTFLKDINGSSNVSRDNLGGDFFRNAKIAAVAFNIRTILLQPTSYLRASAVINNRYLAQAFFFKPKIAKSEKYCGMALWKSLGYYDVNISKGLTSIIKHDKTTKDKVIEFSMKGMELADKVTIGYLWNACELEIRKTRKDLEVGSDEFFETIGKRLREVIYTTQVVDSTMTRSQIMRSSDGRDKMLTAFMSEPTLSYNMLQDALYTASLEKRANGKSSKESRKKIARVITSYIVTNAVCALVESGFDAFRDDDEEEMDIAEFMKLYLTNFTSDLSIIGKIPYIKEIITAIEGYSSSRSDTQWMTSLVNAGKAWGKIISGDGEGQGHKAIKNTIRAFSDFTGLAVYNAYRDFMAALNKLDIFTAEELEEMLDEIFS